MGRLLFLDSWHTSWPERFWIRCKIILKEAIWLGHWDLVFRLGKPFGSLVMGQGLKDSLRARGLRLSGPLDSLSSEVPTVVFRDLRNLTWALAQKRRGALGKLLVGPFVATMPFEYDHVLLDPQIDGLLFLSTWHRDLFLREARSVPRASHIWFAGVDAEYWKPRGDTPRDQVLIFFKQGSATELAQVEDGLKKRGIPYRVIVFGEYEKAEYRELLERSRFVIFIHQSETQGLTSFEAWSMGCPTLHLNPGVMRFLGKAYAGASTCPYLSPQTGLDFKTFDEFPAKLDEMLARWRDFTPRAEVLDKYTLAHSADRFLQILEAP